MYSGWPGWALTNYGGESVSVICQKSRGEETLATSGPARRVRSHTHPVEISDHHVVNPRRRRTGRLQRHAFVQQARLEPHTEHLALELDDLRVVLGTQARKAHGRVAHQALQACPGRCPDVLEEVSAQQYTLAPLALTHLGIPHTLNIVAHNNIAPSPAQQPLKHLERFRLLGAHPALDRREHPTSRLIHPAPRNDLAVRRRHDSDPRQTAHKRHVRRQSGPEGGFDADAVLNQGECADLACRSCCNGRGEEGRRREDVREGLCGGDAERVGRASGECFFLRPDDAVGLVILDGAEAVCLEGCAGRAVEGVAGAGDGGDADFARLQR